MDILTELFDASSISGSLFYIAIVLFVSLILLLLPLQAQSAMTWLFSFRTFGIRKVKRWHSRTDTLANLMLWISVIFCLLAAWIPYAPLIYLCWLTFSWLCCVSRAVRLSEVRIRSRKLTVIFLINLTYGISLLAALGFLNHYALWLRSFLFAQDIMSGEALHLMYFLRSVEPADWLAQTIILILPLTVLWGQFKYMRLENTFKASSLAVYVIKQICFCIFLALFAMAAPQLSETIYSISQEARVNTIEGDYPLRYEDAVRPKDAKSEESKNSDEPESNDVSADPFAGSSAQNEQITPSDPAALPGDENRNEAEPINQNEPENPAAQEPADLPGEQDLPEDEYTEPVVPVV